MPNGIKKKKNFRLYIYFLKTITKYNYFILYICKNIQLNIGIPTNIRII